MLGKITNAQAIAVNPLPAQGLDFTGQKLDEGRFTRAVAAQHAQARACLQTEINVTQNNGIAISDIDLFQAQQWMGVFGGFAEGKTERRIHMGCGNRLHARQSLESALRLARLAGLGAEARHEILHMGNLTLLLLVAALLQRQLLGTLPLKLRVVATVEVDIALLHMGNGIHHIIQKVAVMGDQQQRAWVRQQPLFKPEYGIEVEMVGRLIEQQQIGTAHQRFGEIEPHAPTTGEGADGLHMLWHGESQTT